MKSHLSGYRVGLSALLIGALFISGCSPEDPAEASNAAPSPASLSEAFEGHFLVGAAVNEDQFSGHDPEGASLTASQFNTITPENVLKWEVVHPVPGEFNFGPADQYVAFGEEHGMFVVGHTLIWHSQTPSWVWQDENGEPIGRDAALARMRDHIATVVGRYRGRIDGWDVVNEALNDDGTLRDSPWRRAIGDDYLEHAFRFAAQADPDAELYYNDYSLENEARRNGAVALVRSLQEAGVPIHGIGSQGHNQFTWPSAAGQDSTLRAFGELGVHVMITELDVTVLPRDNWMYSADVSRREQNRAELDPFASGLPDSVSAALATRYAELFEVYLKHSDVVSRVTFWGVTDGDSWLNGWPIPGRTDYPLLFDRNHSPKAAYGAVMATVPLRTASQ